MTTIATLGEDRLPTGEAYGPQTIRETDLPISGQAFFRAMLDELYDGVYFVDVQRRILFWNRAAERLTGYKAEEVIGSYCFANILDHTNSKGCHLCHAGCPLVAATQHGRETHSRVFLRHKDGRRVAVDVHVSPIRDERGVVVGGVEVFCDASSTVALEQAYVAMREMSLKDPLTGLANRRHLDEMLRLQCQLQERTGIPFTVILADIDHFKQVNDGYGHDVGDEILRDFALVLQECSRSSDVVGRFGGEEFLIICPGQPVARTRGMAERLRTQIEARLNESHRPGLAITASFGVAEIRGGESGESLLQRVDAALYRAKGQGRNQVVLDQEAHPVLP